ncbi:tRNA 2-selenouridine(34) synthase MnmH [uncultured Pelagimonas sp.]|uniref:tRNA 2-selenouridine(34) synthase MnmH n=1 Tax=uncultured Pelagimonas sp. TaxID=1618102 RepID=UPI0026220219|nr:tRNA 2-selenouridine(34) synthase MnmH [uncultured Pelagimonas sp.]
MTLKLMSFQAIQKHGYDTVIDVRSPAEFAEDHIPGAINLPVLDDHERAMVGTIYKQESPFKARKIGAALVFRNAANHIEKNLSHHEGGWKPLVYCWRGGKRSGSFSWMLREIGWRSDLIEGGYRSYRRQVTQLLYDSTLDLRFVQLGGYTGTAKTDILHRLRDLGAQVLDLEGVAQHRGSLLGAMPSGQPAQKRFESILAQTLSGFDPKRPVLVEAESSKIGKLNLPPSLWEAMKKAPWFEVTAHLFARAKYLSQTYSDVLENREELVARLQPLRHFRGHATVDNWMQLIERGENVQLCLALSQDHYDPAYDKSIRSVGPKVIRRFDVADLSVGAIDVVTRQIATDLQQMEI